MHDGAATTDFMEQEQERGITIQSAATTGYRPKAASNSTPHPIASISLILLPRGLTVEVYRSLKVLDGGVGVFCGSGGVEPQSGPIESYANDSKVARLIYVNKLDRIGADFYKVVDQVKDRFRCRAAGYGAAYCTESDLKGVVDLLTRKAWVWDESGDPMKYEIQDVPADMADKAEEYRLQLIETAVEQDDDMKPT